MHNFKREVIVSKIMPQNMLYALYSLGYTPVYAKPAENINSELRFHPDILTFRLPDGTWIDENTCDIKLNDRYPNDCVFNCATIRNTLMYGNSYIADRFGGMFERLIKVRQGYVKCSTIVLGDKGIITSDASIYKALTNTFDLPNDFELLKVNNDGILLNGYSCGFIGGTCGVLDDLIVFTGNIEKHIDGTRIIDFAEKLDYKVKSLSDEPLYDYGGILPLN